MAGLERKHFILELRRLRPRERHPEKRDYTYQNGLMLTVERPAGTLWSISDHLGTPVVYQDANHTSAIMGSFVYAYGEDQVNKNPADIGSPKRFTAHERDQNLSFLEVKDDLDYMHARYYSPHMGRFLSADPVVDAKRSAKLPLGWNLYTYAYDNPVGNTDSDGRVVDTVLDVAFIGIDLVQIGQSVRAGQGVSRSQLPGLGGDILGRWYRRWSGSREGRRNNQARWSGSHNSD